jgi:hypothetical protein
MSNGRTITVDTDSNPIYDSGKPIEIERHPRHRVVPCENSESQILRRQTRVGMLTLFENHVELKNRFTPLDVVEADIDELPPDILKTSENTSENVSLPSNFN